MSAAGALTGKDGKVVVGDNNLVLRITEWSISPSALVDEWGDSGIVANDVNTGYTNRKPGRKDCTGSFNCKLDTTKEVYDTLREGSEIQLTLWLSRTAGNYFDFPAAVISGGPNLTVNVDTEEVVAISFDFGACGKFYAPGEAGAPTRTLP